MGWADGRRGSEVAKRAEMRHELLLLLVVVVEILRMASRAIDLLWDFQVERDWDMKYVCSGGEGES